jgi:putative flavoprotein involved in K+ transport
MYDAIVIGAGQAGLAAGYQLKRRNLNYIILEASGAASGSWPHYYKSLRLFSPASYSSLPGMRFPGQGSHYPTRDEVIEYLNHYAAHFELPVITQTRVERVEITGDGYRVSSANGASYVTRSVIAATGAFNRPYIPDIPGMDQYEGQVRHSADYQEPKPFNGQRVVTVGAGNSAVQIAYELAEVARVTLATREPVQYVHQHLLGQDVHFWTWLTGIDKRPSKNGIRAVHVLDTGKYQRALETGKLNRKPMFTTFTESGVEWADGQTECIDAVILATGYRPNLSYLAGVVALDNEGHAAHVAGVSTTLPGLYFMGLDNQRSFASATLRGVGRDADYIVRHLYSFVRKPAAIRTARCCPLPAGS